MAISSLEKMQSKYAGAIVAGSAEAQDIGAESARLERAEPNMDQSMNAELSPTVEDLRKILARYPIKVRATEKRTSVLSPVKFRNEAVLKRVSHLVFYDADCWSFLYDHPADIVDGRNFLEGCD
jgi:hypothetical protein